MVAVDVVVGGGGRGFVIGIFVAEKFAEVNLLVQILLLLPTFLLLLFAGDVAILSRGSE